MSFISCVFVHRCLFSPVNIKKEGISFQWDSFHRRTVRIERKAVVPHYCSNVLFGLKKLSRVVAWGWFLATIATRSSCLRNSSGEFTSVPIVSLDLLITLVITLLIWLLDPPVMKFNKKNLTLLRRLKLFHFNTHWLLELWNISLTLSSSWIRVRGVFVVSKISICWDIISLHLFLFCLFTPF